MSHLFIKIMFTRNFLCLSLLKSKVRLNGDIAVSEGTITFRNNTDFESPNIFENISENSVTKCVITGNVTELIRFSGLEFIEYFEITATGVKEIPNAFFKNSQSIKSVKMHDELVKICSAAFEFSTIFEIDLTKVQAIEPMAFYGCMNLKFANLTSISSLQYMAFASSGLEWVQFSDIIQKIPVKGFEQCTKLKSVKCGSMIKDISDEAFSNCVALSEFDQGEAQIEKIQGLAFQSTLLASIEFKNTITIEAYAFYNSKITTVKGTDITIEGHGLAGCSKLTKIECDNLYVYQSAFFADHAFDEIAAQSIYVNTLGLCGCTQLKKITGEIKLIDDFGFQNCISLTSINISSIDDLGEGAFQGCKNLVSIEFSPSLHVGRRAFLGCEKLVINEISFYSTLCFAGCNSLKRVKYTGNYLDVKMFFNCIGLESFTATKEINTVNDGCFQNCINLVSVTFINPVELKEFVFCNTSIKSLDGIQIGKFGSYCFAYTPLTVAFIFEDSSDNAEYIYYKCPNLKTVTIKYADNFNPRYASPREYACIAECPEFSTYLMNRDDGYFFENGVLYFNKSRTIILSVASKGLPETFIIPNTVERIRQGAFTSAISCKKIIIKHNIKTLEMPSLFTGIEELIYDPVDPDYILQMSIWYFNTSLVTLKLNGKVELEQKAFRLLFCQKLETVVLHESTLKNCSMFIIQDSPKFKGIDLSNLGKSLSNDPIYIIHGAGRDLRWSHGSYQEETFSGVGFLNDMYDPLLVENVVMPDVIKFIELKAFSKYKNIKKVKFSKVLEVIGERAFDGAKIEELELPATLKTIEKGAFRYSPLKKVTLEGGENHQYLKIVDNQLIERSTGRLILTFGELPKELRLSDDVKYVEYYSLKSSRTKKYEEGRVDYKGVETLIVPASVSVMQSGFMGESSYISSICFEGKPPYVKKYSEKSYYGSSQETSDYYIVYGYPNNRDRGLEISQRIIDNDLEIPVIDPKLYSQNYTGSLEQNRWSNSYINTMYDMPINYRKCADQSVDQLDMNTPPGYSFGGGGDGFGYGGFVWRGFTALGLALLILCIVLSCINIILVVYIIYKKHKKDDEEEEEPEAQFNQETVGIGTVTGQEITNDNPLYMQGTADDAFADDFRDSDSV